MTKTELTEKAEGLGIDVKSSWTMAQIQDAIDTAEASSPPVDDEPEQPEVENLDPEPENLDPKPRAFASSGHTRPWDPGSHHG